MLNLTPPPDPRIKIINSDILLSFYVNAFQFPEFSEEESGVLRFVNCWRYRLEPKNDEGWYHGQSRSSNLVPAWGEYQKVSDDSDILDESNDWKYLSSEEKNKTHFLFNFPENTFECDAESCLIEPKANN